MKSVVVTGGTVRLGKVIAEHLRANGWLVLTTSHRQDSGADIVVDFRLPNAAEQCWSAAKQLLNGQCPQALVNNAALYVGEDKAVAAIGFEAPKRLIELMAVEAEAGAAVVNVLDATSGSGSYARAKTALREYTREAAINFAKRLRVNAVSPGSLCGLNPVAVHEKAQAVPLARPRPEDVAQAVRFLLENRAITRQDLIIDGGAWTLGARQCS